MSASASVSACEIDIDVGTAIIKLLTKSIQATIMGSLGPFVLYFGTDIGNIVCVVQASLIADFAVLSYQFEGFCPAKIPIIAKTMVSVVMSTVGVAFGMIKDEGFRRTSQGISLAMIAVTPLMGSVSKPILEATDQETCAPTPDFPGGAPCGKATSGEKATSSGASKPTNAATSSAASQTSNAATSSAASQTSNAATSSGASQTSNAATSSSASQTSNAATSSGTSQTSNAATSTGASGGGQAEATVVPPDLCELPDLSIDAMFSLWFVAGLPTLTALCFARCASLKMPEIKVPDIDANLDLDAKLKLDANLDLDAKLKLDPNLKLDAYMNVDANLDLDAKLKLDPKLDVNLDAKLDAALKLKGPKLSCMMKLMMKLKACKMKLDACKLKLTIAMKILGDLLVDLAVSFTGTYMTLKGFLDIGLPSWQIADPCGFEAALPGINAVITTLTYAVGGASFFLQRCRKAGRGADKKPKGIVAKLNAKIGKMAGQYNAKQEGKGEQKKGENEKEEKEEEEKKKKCEKCGKKCLHCDPPKRKAIDTQTWRPMPRVEQTEQAEDLRTAALSSEKVAAPKSTPPTPPPGLPGTIETES